MFIHFQSKRGRRGLPLAYFAELVPQVQLGPHRQMVQLQFDLSFFTSFFVFMIFIFL
jgi:hypothetical protein